MATNTIFSDYVKNIRQKSGCTLRQFCQNHGLDPGNISRIERGIAPPPASRELLGKYARCLSLKPGTDDWYTFFDLAAASSGRVPADVMNDEQLVNKLPLVFRTLRDNRASEGKLDELAELIRNS